MAPRDVSEDLAHAGLCVRCELANQKPADPGSLRSLAGLRVLVMGLGRFGGGVGVTKWLVQQRARVTVTDHARADALAQSLEAIRDLDVTLHLGGHDSHDLDDADLVVINPAVDKKRSAFFQSIVGRNVPWTTELNLFCQRCPATVIGITGTYGKSTTCAMVAAGLRASCDAAGGDFSGVYLGGNIGGSLLPDLDRMRASDVVVLELSNAQLEDSPRIDWVPHVAVITNLLPHHLDRYATFDEYVSVKLNIVRASSYASRVIIGDVDPRAEAVLVRTAADRGSRFTRVERLEAPLELAVPGEHNQINAACALTVLRHLDADGPAVREALRTFPGLPHRLQHVRTLDGVDYYNDSKATSPDAATTAVRCFDGPVVAIVGGKDKDVPLDEWSRTVTEACRLVICVGESGPIFADALRSVGTGGGGSVRETPSLEAAVRLARTEASSGGVVLFSPGAPSFDQYPNFAARGAHFISLVNAL